MIEILVLGELAAGGLAPATGEMITAARGLQGEVGVALQGDGLDDLANEAIALGADKVFLAQDPLLAQPIAVDAHVAAFEQVRKDFCVQRGDVSWFVEAVPDRSRPAPDLEALAAGRHPAASLARRLLALERDDDEGGRLVREGIHRLREAAAGGAWSGLEAPTLTPETVRERLLTAGYDALEQLEASRVR